MRAEIEFLAKFQLLTSEAIDDGTYPQPNGCVNHLIRQLEHIQGKQ